MSVEIKWSADCDGVFVAKQYTALLDGQWAEIPDNARAAVEDICEDFFTAEIWAEWIGYDDSNWLVNVEIHSPASIAGTYEVELERTTKARARAIQALKGEKI